MNDPRQLYAAASLLFLGGAAFIWSRRAAAATDAGTVADAGADLGIESLGNPFDGLQGIADYFTEGITDMVNQVTPNQAAATNPQRLSAAGLVMLQKIESFSATPYKDDYAGTPEVEFSIGYGHQIKPGEVFTRITKEEGVQLLAVDVQSREAVVLRAVRVPINQAQFDALVIFAYNVGESAFLKSTLLRKLNAGDAAGAAAEFNRWIYSGGKVSASLQDRAVKQAALFQSGVYA